MSDEKPPAKSVGRVISPISGSSIPVPGPGRPKGSKSKWDCPSNLKHYWIKEYRALCKATAEKGYESPLVWAFHVAESDPKIAERLAMLIFDRRFPSAVDPDQAILAETLAKIEAEGRADADIAGSQNVQIVLGSGLPLPDDMRARQQVIDVEPLPALPEPDRNDEEEKGGWDFPKE